MLSNTTPVKIGSMYKGVPAGYIAAQTVLATGIEDGEVNYCVGRRFGTRYLFDGRKLGTMPLSEFKANFDSAD